MFVNIEDHFVNLDQVTYVQMNDRMIMVHFLNRDAVTITCQNIETAEKAYTQLMTDERGGRG